ncbi:MAG: PAS domain S-box protein, partial [Desulfomonile sp.]|nr:PAS domain S-box protein [Desulfomonile sp.]
NCGTGQRLNLLLRRNGEERYVETKAAPIRDEYGAIVGTVLVFRDITDSRRLYERLQLLSAATEQSSEGIAVVDLEGTVLFLNQAFAEMHGRQREEVLGKHLSIFHNEEQIPSVRIANRIVREHGFFSGEVWHTRADGTVFPGLMHNSLLRNEQGEPIGVIGTLKDITETKRTEEALRESHEKLEAYSSSLEKIVRERTQDLENSSKELKKYSESLEKTNEALKLIIQGVEAQKKDVEEKIAQNLNLTVSPIIDQLKSQDLPETAQFLLKSLEFNVTNIASTFGLKMTKEGQRLTPKELRICDMIRSGLSSKQMAKVMGISAQTILVHRKNIRKKLGLAKAKKNLASYLKSSL